ncbi:hypothetical protein ACOSQ3_012551 [Xanthoceras sorbifolium]
MIISSGRDEEEGAVCADRDEGPLVEEEHDEVPEEEGCGEEVAVHDGRAEVQEVVHVEEVARGVAARGEGRVGRVVEDDAFFYFFPSSCSLLLCDSLCFGVANCAFV